METRLRRIFLPVATLLPEGPQLETFRPWSRIPLLHLLPLLLRPLGTPGMLLLLPLRPDFNLLLPRLLLHRRWLKRNNWLPGFVLVRQP